VKTIERVRERAADTHQAAPPSRPTNRRVKRLGGRQLLGFVLILTSLALGIAVVESADQRVAVVVAARDISAGLPLEREDLMLVPMHLGASLQQYATSIDSLVGTIASSYFSVGELIGKAEESPEESRIITLPLRLDRSPGLRRGDRVDIWATPQESGKLIGAPQLIAEDLLAVDVDLGRQGAVGGSLSLALTPEYVARLVEAVESAVLTVVKR
jgi:hypothetical protein